MNKVNFTYTKKEIDLLENQLNSIKNMLLTNDDYEFFEILAYSIDEELIKKGWFIPIEINKYHISSIILKTSGGMVDRTDTFMCSHIGVNHLMNMKKMSDYLIKNLNQIDYSIVKREQET